MKYLSKYSNNKSITEAQYIVEIICENKAKLENKDLYFRFWTNKEWSKYYRDQIATANKLVKKYSAKAIIQALKNPKASKIYSLRAPHLIPIIEQEMAVIETQNTTISKDYDRSDNKKFSDIKQNKKSLISKLKDLE
jgi:hypothetical protein